MTRIGYLESHITLCGRTMALTNGHLGIRYYLYGPPCSLNVQSRNGKVSPTTSFVVCCTPEPTDPQPLSESRRTPTACRRTGGQTEKVTPGWLQLWHHDDLVMMDSRAETSGSREILFESSVRVPLPRLA